MAINPKSKKNLKPFVNGADKRRNTNGRPRKLPALDELLADILGEEKDGVTAAAVILKVLRAKASKGDIRAAELLLDRAYGKAKQISQVEHSGEIQIPVIQIVKPNE